MPQSTYGWIRTTANVGGGHSEITHVYSGAAAAITLTWERTHLRPRPTGILNRTADTCHPPTGSHRG